MTGSLRTLLADIIDYAGLFPPAKLGMPAAVEAYNRARLSDHEWMLGRFVCPVSRLAEFEQCASPLLPGTFGTSGYKEHAEVGDPWRITAIIDGPLPAQLDLIDHFNERHTRQDAGFAAVDMIELKVTTVDEIDPALDEIPEDIVPFFEFPAGLPGTPNDCRGFVAALSGTGAAAKIRTGGVVPGAFPTPAEVIAFMNACAAADVRFKATAGLHHPVCGNYRLTYEKDTASCGMFGFLNIFMAACFIRIKGENDAEALKLLTEEEPMNFKFLDGAASWCGHGLDTAQIAMARESFSLSFGSCSFDEPIEDLTRIGLL